MPALLWHSGADNTQLMIDSSSGRMVTWYPFVRCSVFTKANCRPTAVSQKNSCLQIMVGRALLQNPKCFSCDSPTGACQRLQTASLSATDTSSTIRSSGLFGPHSLDQPTQQPAPIEIFPVPGHTHLRPALEHPPTLHPNALVSLP